MPTAPFPNKDRFDARDKVTGATKFVADIAFPNVLYAMLAPARIAKGRVTGIDTAAALNVAGVVRVLTDADFLLAEQPATGTAAAFPPPPPTLTRQVSYYGEPIAVVLAETLEAVIEGAEAVRAIYTAEPFISLMTASGTGREPVKPVVAGDAAAAMSRAATTVEVEYQCPAQHHNPIELLPTTAVWQNGRLTIYESTQAATLVKMNTAGALRLDPALIDVKSSYVGGGFGQKGAGQRQTALIARAAMLTGRPVKLVLPRGQIFQNATFRPFSKHKIKIGADAAGKMIAVEYDAAHQQSREGHFAPEYHDVTTQLYGIADYHGTAADVRIDTQAPGYMRAPHPHPACFAFESAVDELAYKLGRDPVAFRLAHDTTTDPMTGRMLSSRFLKECMIEGARRFGWERRNPKPASTVLPDGTQVGWGVGCGAYPALVSANIVTLEVFANGATRLALAAHEMGQGIRSVIAGVLLRELDIDPDKLEIVIGDTSAAPQHATGGSWGTASVAPAVENAAQQLKAQTAQLLGGRKIGGNLHRQLATVRRPSVQVEVAQLAPGQPQQALMGLRMAGFAVAGPNFHQFTSYSYIVHFVEVRVEPRTRRVRLPRVVSIADCGRVVSPRTAASQVRGGVVWAIGSALREESEVDPRFGGWLNNDLADYVVPVNADIGEIEVDFVDRPDPVLSTIGAKGLGEVAMVGASAAIANAIFHATGRRIRRMPIRIEHLL